MKRLSFLMIILLAITLEGIGQAKVKNVIVMIPDGTSLPVLSLSRWYKYGACPADNCRLAIDPHISGLVRTYNSDSPIGDSAPTGSTYATGYLSNSGFIATYPVTSGAMDLVTVDTTRSYQPLFTLLEAAKVMGKSTGLVVTCQFPHATPADFSAHTPDRDEMDLISMQMVHNHLNIVLGGGLDYISPDKREDGVDLEKVLLERNYLVVKDRAGFDRLSPADTLVYGLFAGNDLPYDLDRDPKVHPSLAEMTRKAIQSLSRDPDGFFLMVEGSKVDWAAHANDPVGMATEFLAFDEAVKEAMDFANRDGNTVVLICPDHGNSGISIGNKETSRSYDAMDLRNLIDPLKRCTLTANGIAIKIKEDPAKIREIIKDATGITISSETEKELTVINEKEKISVLTGAIARVISSTTVLGFTTNGHTGEDVILASYHPGGYQLKGFVSNIEVNRYLAEVMGVPSLDSLTAGFYSRDDKLLAGYVHEITYPGSLPERVAKKYPSLVIRKNSGSGKYVQIDAYTDYLMIFDGKKQPTKFMLGSLVVYVENGKGFSHFYLPRSIIEKLQNLL